MKTILSSVAVILAFSSTAFGDVDLAKGEKDFKKCKSCHSVITDDGEVLFKGGKTGPNLYGVVGRQAGTVEGYKYSPTLISAGEEGLIWTEELLGEFVKNPKGFLKEHTGDAKAKTKMSFKFKKPENVMAYLASLAPQVEAEGETEDAMTETVAEGDSTATN
jgi:cytochrome c